VIEAWFVAGCPSVSPTRTSRHAREKSPNTKANARQLLGTSVLPSIGALKVDRTTTRRLEELFESMVETHAMSAIDRNWNYLNQALEHGVRNRTIKANPAAGVLLPAKRPSKERKSFTVGQALALLTEAIPADSRPAMWLTGSCAVCVLASSPGFAGRTRSTFRLDPSGKRTHANPALLAFVPPHGGSLCQRSLRRRSRSLGLRARARSEKATPKLATSAVRFSWLSMSMPSDQGFRGGADGIRTHDPLLASMRTQVP
jgi:hypothetical protein